MGKSRRLVFLVVLPPSVPSVIGSKVTVQGYTCAYMHVYTITSSFLDGLI